MVQTNFSAGSASALATDLELIDTGGADSAAGSSYTITLTADIALNAGLPAIDLATGASLTIVGQGDTINGQSGERGLFLQAGNLVLENVTIQDTRAQGSAGQSETGDAGAGGGGAGLGGGLFIADGASATLSSVTFLDDAAIGGAGGSATLTTVSAGTPAGGLLDGGMALPGGFGDGGAGATGPANPALPIGPGTAGKFGGGGGGGSGTGTLGALGGFGAGDGAAVSLDQGQAGGGGLGAGGDIFIQQGGNLTIAGATLTGGTATGGAGGATIAGSTTLDAVAGLGLGGGIFAQGNDTITLAPPSGTTDVIDDPIGDESGAALPKGVGTGSGALALVVSGDVVLGAVNSYTGGTTIQSDGTLELAASASAGSGPITLDRGATLQLDGGNGVGAVSFSNPATIAVCGTDQLTTLSGYGSLTGNGTLQLDRSTLGSVLFVSFYVTLQMETAGTIAGGGLFDLFDGTLDLNGFNQTITNPDGLGTVLLDGATLTLSGVPPRPGQLDWAFTGPGLVRLANNLTLDLSAPLTAPFELNQGDALTLVAGMTAGATIEFAGTGDVLTIDPQTGTQLAGSISGFGSADTILVAGTVTAVDNTDAGLVLQDGSTVLGTLDLVGSDSADGVLVDPVSGGTTEIVLYQASIDLIGGTAEVSPVLGATVSLNQLLIDPGIATGGTIGALCVGGPGTIEATGSVAIDGLEAAAGSAVLLDGAVVAADPITVDPQGDITGFGTLLGATTVNGSVTPQHGTLSLIGSEIQVGAAAGADAVIVVAGAGNVLDTAGAPLSVGVGGSGSLLVSDGGTVSTLGGASSGGLALGTSSGGSGQVSVSGSGSALDNAGSLVIGESGLGALFVTAGGQLSTNPAVGASGPAAAIAADPGSDGSAATVSGAGSDWSLGGSLVVGDQASGSLAITQGGSVGATALVLGNAATGAGALSLSGSASALTLGGALVVGAAGAGNLSISAGATLTAAAAVIGQDPGSSGVIDIEGSGSRLDIAGDLDIGEAGAGVLILGAGNTTLSVEGNLNIGPDGELIQFGGVIDPANETNDNTVRGAGTTTITGTLTNDGEYFVQDGSFELDVGTLITGSGTLAVDDGGDFIINAGSVADTQQVVFNNDTAAAVLTIGTLATFGAVLENFNTLASIVLSGTTVGSDAYTAGTDGADGVLTLYAGAAQSGGVLGTLSVSAAITAGGVADLEMVSDGTIGADPSCFAAGTRIATPAGEAAVETLRVGDRVRVLGAAGAAPVVWLGHRHVDCRHHPRPRAVWPVRVAAGAFGPGRPGRDLWLSPDHALWLEGVLIPVKYLIDGVMIAQVPCERVSYYHVELPRHGVLLAEGLAAESYLDTGERGNFANGGGVLALYPDFAALRREAAGCAPLVVVGREVEAARQLLAAARRRAA